MNTKKLAILTTLGLLSIITLLTGCTSWANVVKAQAASNAAVTLDVNTMWATIHYRRINPTTNTLTAGETSITTK